MAEKAPTADEKKWQAEADLRTLEEAEKIMKDPERMEAARKEAAKKHEVLQNIRAKLEARKGAKE
ncbi:MAG: hypothetical protein ABSG17_11305 [Spirochaetia bacterium]|jgi:hypothetical protein